MKKLLLFVFSVFLFGACSEDDTITRTAEEQIPPLINLEFHAVPALDPNGFIFSGLNLYSATVEFNGTANAEFIVEGSQDLQDWTVVPVVNAADSTHQITSSFFTGSGQASFRVKTGGHTFFKIRQLSGSDIMKDVNILAGYTDRLKVIKFSGDSLTQGAGAEDGESISALFQEDYADYLIVNDAIGGQDSKKIFTRQGGLPLLLSLEGNTLSGSATRTVNEISCDFLTNTSPAVVRRIAGSLNGNRVVIKQSYGNYTVTAVAPIVNEEVPAGSVLIPDAGSNYKDVINIVWAGRNDQGALDNLLEDYTKTIATFTSPARFIVIGILLRNSEPEGTSKYNRVITFNNSLREAYPDNYVEVLPPTAEEMASVGYVPNDDDLEFIANGQFPRGLKADGVHLNGYGYKIMKARVKARFDALGY